MKPTAAPAYFPYTWHRTMAEVLRDEHRRQAWDRKRYATERSALR